MTITASLSCGATTHREWNASVAPLWSRSEVALTNSSPQGAASHDKARRQSRSMLLTATVSKPSNVCADRSDSTCPAPDLAPALPCPNSMLEKRAISDALIHRPSAAAFGCGASAHGWPRR